MKWASAARCATSAPLRVRSLGYLHPHVECSVERYRNLSGDSGVEFYEILDRAIKIRFRGGPAYVYDDVRPGDVHVRHMQELARRGQGLSTYISKYVRTSYSRIEP